MPLLHGKEWDELRKALLTMKIEILKFIVKDCRMGKVVTWLHNRLKG